MKRIIVRENHVAVVSNKYGISHILTAGQYWLKAKEQAEIFDKSHDFPASKDADILLCYPEFAEQVQVVLVPEGHISMMYWNDTLIRVLNTGRHIFWKSLKSYEFETVNISTLTIQDSIPKNILQKSMLTPYLRMHKIDPNEKGILYVDGKFDQVLEAGVYYWWNNHIAISVSKADMRQTMLELNGQEVLTKDKAQIRLNFSIKYQITDIIKALVENKDVEKQLYSTMQLALREYTSQVTLDELMENKGQVTARVKQAGEERAGRMGVTVLDCGLKDVILPGEMKEIMNQVLIAEKKAQANSIMRREETAATRSLLNTAKLMEDNAMLMRLKEMEYIEKIAEKINSISLSGSHALGDQLKQLFTK